MVVSKMDYHLEAFHMFAAAFDNHGEVKGHLGGINQKGTRQRLEICRTQPEVDQEVGGDALPLPRKTTLRCDKLL